MTKNTCYSHWKKTINIQSREGKNWSTDFTTRKLEKTGREIPKVKKHASLASQHGETCVSQVNGSTQR